MRRYEYDEELDERHFSWTDLFIKVIIALIVILFIVWLISLPSRNKNKTITKTTTSVITNANAFSENINQMRDVGQSYFTTERLPQKVGEVKTITLERMYSNKMLLPLNDKYGKACSAKNSYVSVEKKDNEYQMKVYLECGEDSDYIIVTMGCYDYCKSDVCAKEVECEKKTECEKEPVAEKSTVEKTPSNVSVEYQYSKSTGTWSSWSDFSKWGRTIITPNDYTDVEMMVAEDVDDNQVQYKYMGTPSCPTVDNYTVVSSANGVCSYVAENMSTTYLSCPELSGYTLTGRSNSICSYAKLNISRTSPTCPSASGYTLTERSGFACFYKSNTKSTETIIKSARCPYGYNEGLSDCIKSTTSVATRELKCPDGYKASGNTCIKSVATTTTRDLACPSGQILDDGNCYKVVEGTSNNVTFYRYRTRTYTSGPTDYKWSNSNNDATLLNAGYKLTGTTRNANASK